MTDVSHSTRGVRSLILGAALFLSCAYFYEAGGWNQNSRFDMVRAVVGHRTLQIDRFAANTGDKAVHDGHIYSDKAPGVALSAIPFVEVASRILRAWGVDPESPGGVTALSYVATVIVSGLSTALAGVCLALTAEALFGSASAGLLVAVAFALGTPAWAYATLLMGHALATSCVVFAFGAAVALGRTPHRSPARRAGVCRWSGRRLGDRDGDVVGGAGGPDDGDGRSGRSDRTTSRARHACSAACWSARWRVWPCCSRTTRWRSDRRSISGMRANRASTN